MERYFENAADPTAEMQSHKSLECTDTTLSPKFAPPIPQAAAVDTSFALFLVALPPSFFPLS